MASITIQRGEPTIAIATLSAQIWNFLIRECTASSVAKPHILWAIQKDILTVSDLPKALYQFNIITSYIA